MDGRRGWLRRGGLSPEGLAVTCAPSTKGSAPTARRRYHRGSRGDALANASSVLVVHDGVAIRDALQELLSLEGYHVLVAQNGVEALDAMRSVTPPDAVVLDLMMPVMSGWEVLEVADEDSALRAIPIVVASAMPAPLASRDRRGGVRTCLAKPLEISALLEALRSLGMETSTETTSPHLRRKSSEGATIGRKVRVLAIEDSPADAALLSIALRHGGCEAHLERVATAAEYNAALDRGGWDVIISDFTMPGFSGRAALDILRARGLDVPFIIVSGALGEEVAVEVMKAGADDFFAKGNLTRLASAVEREVREAAGRRQHIDERLRGEAKVEQLLGDLRSALKARDDFLSIVGHELRTPLTSLQLEVQLLQRRLSSDAPVLPRHKMEAKMTTIARQVARLTSLVNGLLDVTCFETGQMALVRETFDLKDVVTEVLARSDETIQKSRSQITVRTESVSGSWDRFRIESVVANLILNALKYGEGKPIEIRLDEIDGIARLVIVDHGIGIALNEQERIFDKFERAVAIKHYGGFGLGLWIARQAIVAHGGDIRCESRPGLGSTFTVEMPRCG